LFTVKAFPSIVTVAEKSGAVVDAKVLSFKSGFKVMQFLAAGMIGSLTGEEDETFALNLTDNKNDSSDLTVDATNKNERFSTTDMMWSSVLNTDGTPKDVMRLSQAFILQTGDHSYKNIPKAYLNTTADVALKFDAKKDTDLVWAFNASPETANRGAESLSILWAFTLESLCTKWASTDVGGEGDVNCLYNGTGDVETGYTDLTVYFTDSNTYLSMALPSSGANQAGVAVNMTSVAVADSTQPLFAIVVSAALGALWKNTSDSVSAVIKVSGGA